MSTIIFSSEPEAIALIQSRIASACPAWNDSYEFKDKVFDMIEEIRLVERIVLEPQKPSNGLGLLLPKINYAVRNDDIKLIDAVVTGITAAASTNFFSSQEKALTAVIGVLGALLKLERDVLKGVWLLPDELSVLTLLKRFEPIETEKLLLLMAEGREDFDEPALTRLLGDLSQKKNMLGTKVALVSKTIDGRWVTTI